MIRKMDWTASQEIDLLLAVGYLTEPVARKAHKLRRKRNGIVHDLDDATSAEAAECAEFAAQLAELPAAGPFEARRVFL